MRSLVGVDDAAAVERHGIDVRGAGAAGDQDELPGEKRRPVERHDLQRVRVHEAGGPVVGRDPVAFELRADDFHLARHDGVDPKGEIRHGDGVLQGVVPSVERPLLDSGEIEDRLAQRLRRDRTGVEADAAHHLLAVDDRDALADLRRGDGALLPGRARPDDDEVVLVGFQQIAPHGSLTGRSAALALQLRAAGARPVRSATSPFSECSRAARQIASGREGELPVESPRSPPLQSMQ
jgi:hypothetical protein